LAVFGSSTSATATAQSGGDGSIMRARMNKSAMVRTDDTIALDTFHDLTEKLWRDTH
jgi:hypothetical protein